MYIHIHIYIVIHIYNYTYIILILLESDVGPEQVTQIIKHYKIDVDFIWSDQPWN